MVQPATEIIALSGAGFASDSVREGLLGKGRRRLDEA
jgi:hypothetical protein